MRAFLDNIAEIVGNSNVFTDKADLLAWSARPGGTPAALPLGIARPVNLAQAAELVRLCLSKGVGLHPRGGGTLPISLAPSGPWLVLLTAGLNRILSIEPENSIATVQAGVSIKELNNACVRHGLFFPPETQAPGLRTIGGIAAANSPGESFLKYGAPSNYIETLEVLTGTGERMHLFSCNSIPGKLEPGLPLASLYCGSCGTLGLIGLIRLHLLPRPQTSLTLAAAFKTALAAARAVSEIAASSLLPGRLNFFNEPCARLLGTEYPFIVAEFSGTAQETQSQAEAAREMLKAAGAREIRQDNKTNYAERFPAAFALKKQQYSLLIASCPNAAMPAFTEALESISRDRGVEIAVCSKAASTVMLIAVYGEAGSRKAACNDLFILELVVSGRIEQDAPISREEWIKAHPPLLSDTIRNIFDPDGVFRLNHLPGSVL